MKKMINLYDNKIENLESDISISNFVLPPGGGNTTSITADIPNCASPQKITRCVCFEATVEFEEALGVHGWGLMLISCSCRVKDL